MGRRWSIWGRKKGKILPTDLRIFIEWIIYGICLHSVSVSYQEISGVKFVFIKKTCHQSDHSVTEIIFFLVQLDF